MRSLICTFVVCICHRRTHFRMAWPIFLPLSVCSIICRMAFFKLLARDIKASFGLNIVWNRRGNNKWASSPENLSSRFSTRVDSNRLAQLQKLARGLKFQIYKLEILYYLSSEQQMCWSDCADVQADPHLCCSHRHKTGFLMTWL